MFDVKCLIGLLCCLLILEVRSEFQMPQRNKELLEKYANIDELDAKGAIEKSLFVKRFLPSRLVATSVMPEEYALKYARIPRVFELLEEEMNRRIKGEASQFEGSVDPIFILGGLRHGAAIELLMQSLSAEEELARLHGWRKEDLDRAIADGWVPHAGDGRKSGYIVEVFKRLKLEGTRELPHIDGYFYDEASSKAWELWWQEHGESIMRDADKDYKERLGDDAWINLPSSSGNRQEKGSSKPLFTPEVSDPIHSGSNWWWLFFCIPAGLAVVLGIRKQWSK